jgi:hypothetical protein
MGISIQYQEKRESVGDRLKWCESLLLWASKCLLFPVTLEWSTWVCEVIHSLSGLPSCNLVCDRPIANYLLRVSLDLGILCNKYHWLCGYICWRVQLSPIRAEYSRVHRCEKNEKKITSDPTLISRTFIWPQPPFGASANVVSRGLHY